MIKPSFNYETKVIWVLACRVGVYSIVKQESFNGLGNFCTLISMYGMVWILVGGQEDLCSDEN
jgi:hypothetical protein